MKLQQFGLLTDENISRAMLSSLREAGFDVLDVIEQGWGGQDDSSLLAAAHDQQRIVVTHDRDFGTLAIAESQPMTGIIYLRPGHIDPQFSIQTWRTLILQNLELEPPFLIVAQHVDTQVRVRVRSLGNS